MFKTVKNFLRGVTAKPASQQMESEHVTPVSLDEAAWASFEVDPELAYHCRNQPGTAVEPVVESPVAQVVAEAVVTETADSRAMPEPDSAERIEVLLTTGFAMPPKDEVDAAPFAMSHPELLADDVPLNGDISAAITKEVAAPAKTSAPKPVKAAGPPAAKKAATKPKSAGTAKTKVKAKLKAKAPAKKKAAVPAATTQVRRPSGLGLSKAKAWVFPTADSHCLDESVETVRLDLLLSPQEAVTA